VSVRLARQDAVAVLTVDRPEALNALDRETLGRLRDSLNELAEDESVRAVVLTGEGDRAFVGRLLETMPKPTIAAINGFALGGGCELALACDIRYASSSAKIGQPEVSIGVIPGWGGTQRLARACGIGFAKELVLTGRMVGAEEARERGLVNAVFSPEDLMDRTLELARSLAAKSPLVLARAKELTNRSLQADLTRSLADEAEAFADLFASDDQKEGMAAFLEKREPHFTGR
jgi:enoyl-CoA hydratase